MKKTLLILILIFSSFYRFWQIEERFIFSGETNNVLYAVEKLVNGKQSPLLGLVAAEYVQHLFHTPWYLYLMTPVYFLGRGSPLTFAILHSFLGIVGTYLLFESGRLLFSTKVGLIAAWINTFWLTTIIVDREVWAVGLVPFGSIVALYFMGGLKKNPIRFNFLILGVWFSIWLSFHYQVILSILAVLIWVWWKQRKYFKWVLCPLIASLLPLIVFDLRHQFFNLHGLWLVARSLAENTRPYSSSYFLYQFQRPIILLISVVMSRLNWKLVSLGMLLFGAIETKDFLVYKADPSYEKRKNLINNILNRWEGGKLEVYFKDISSYEYRYLLKLKSEKRGLNPNAIVIYEPWQPVNGARLRIESDELTVL